MLSLNSCRLQKKSNGTRGTKKTAKAKNEAIVKRKENVKGISLMIDPS